jgi:CheY-like chemotaxis protein
MNQPPRKPTANRIGHENQRVLVIDDSAVARMAMVELLSNAGFRVFELTSAIGATRTIMQNNIVAVVADISMPGLSGDKLVAVLRKNPRLKHLTLILVSGRDDDELRQVMSEQEVDAVLSKRSIRDRLVTCLEIALRRRGENNGEQTGS